MRAWCRRVQFPMSIQRTRQAEPGVFPLQSGYHLDVPQGTNTSDVHMLACSLPSSPLYVRLDDRCFPPPLQKQSPETRATHVNAKTAGSWCLCTPPRYSIQGTPQRRHSGARPGPFLPPPPGRWLAGRRRGGGGRGVERGALAEGPRARMCRCQRGTLATREAFPHVFHAVCYGRDICAGRRWHYTHGGRCRNDEPCQEAWPVAVRSKGGGVGEIESGDEHEIILDRNIGICTSGSRSGL